MRFWSFLIIMRASVFVVRIFFHRCTKCRKLKTVAKAHCETSNKASVYSEGYNCFVQICLDLVLLKFCGKMISCAKLLVCKTETLNFSQGRNLLILI